MRCGGRRGGWGPGRAGLGLAAPGLLLVKAAFAAGDQEDEHESGGLCLLSGRLLPGPRARRCGDRLGRPDGVDLIF